MSTSSDETVRLAAAIGNRLHGGEVIELISDLGGGKTTFVRGLAVGMGSTDKVASPSFTISRQYKAGGKTLYHFDFYRLQDAGIVANELAEVVGDSQAVVAVEWADIVENVLPADKLTVSVRSTGETARELTFTYPESLSYLIADNT